MKTAVDGTQTTKPRTNSWRDETSSDKVSDPLSGIVITNAYHTGENEPSTSQSASQEQDAGNTVMSDRNSVMSSTSLTCLLCSEPLEKNSSLFAPKRKKRKGSGWSVVRKKKKNEKLPSAADGSVPATVFARALMSFESISKIKFAETEEEESGREQNWIQFCSLTKDDKGSDSPVENLLSTSDHPCCDDCYGKLKRFHDLTTNLSSEEAVENAEVNEIWEEIVANIQTKTHSSVVLPAWAPLKSSLLKFTKPHDSRVAITTEQKSSAEATVDFPAVDLLHDQMQRNLPVFEENEVEVGEEFLVENVKAEHSTESHLCSSSYLQSQNQENQMQDNEEIASQIAWPQFNLSSVASKFSTQPAQQSQSQSQPSISAQPVIESSEGTQQATLQELESCKKELDCLRNENKLLKEDLKATKCQVEELQICLNILDEKFPTVTRQLDEKIENEARLKMEFDMEILRLMREHEDEKKNIQAKIMDQQKSKENLKEEKDKLQQQYKQQCLDLSLCKQKLEGFEEEARKKEKIRFHDACFQTEESVSHLKTNDSDFEHYNVIIAESLNEELAINSNENHQILQSFVMDNNEELTQPSAQQPCLVLVQDTPDFNCETLPQQNQIIQFSGSRVASANPRDCLTGMAEIVTVQQNEVETKDLENSHFENPNSGGCIPEDSLGQSNIDFSSEPEISSEVQLGKRRVKDHSTNKYCKKNLSTGLYECTICQKPLKRAYNFFLHYQAIHLNKKFNCDRCSRPFSQYAGLKVHQRTCNGKARVKIQKRKIYYTRDRVTGMLQCSKCEIKSQYRATIVAHYEKIHLKKLYKCEICNIKEYSNQSGLTKHMKTCRETVEDMKQDGKEMVFVCKVCEKQFPTKLGLTMHMRVHLNNGYPCDLCKETFLYKNCYVKHIPNCLKRNSKTK